MKLSELQQKVIDAPYNKVVVIASAASGKTRCMTEKVRQLLRAGVNPRDIAVITFTNMAAGELRNRLGDDYKDGLFVGTIHALANYMLCVGGVDTSKILSQEKFDELFEMVEQNPHIIKHYDWILLDEAQDTDPLQFKFLFEMIDPPHFFVVGDPKQCIYQFKGSDPSLIMELVAHEDVQLLNLNENYRNGNNILSYAKRIIYPTGLKDTSIALHFGDGVVVETPEALARVADRIHSRGNYGDWAILCRTNTQVNNACLLLKKANIPFDSFKQGDLTNDELANKMQANTVKVLTIHSAKGLEWDNVIVVGALFKKYDDTERNVNYVAATRARDYLVWERKSQNTNLRRW